MNNTDEAAAFLRQQHAGPTKWKALCLMLQRSARGLPPVYPSAHAAMVATPESERVFDRDKVKRGMVCYYADFNDSNPSDHITFAAGHTADGRNLDWTNDAKRIGGVDLVDSRFFESQWGDKFQFAAGWLNGFDFTEFNKPPVAVRGSLKDNYKHAIEDIEREFEKHKKAGHTKLAELLKRDLDRMKKRYQNWKD